MIHTENDLENTLENISENTLEKSLVSENLAPFPSFEPNTTEETISIDQDTETNIEEIHQDAPSSDVPNQLQEALLLSLNQLHSKCDRLQQEFSEKIHYTDVSKNVVDQMHQELQKYKADFYAQLLKPVFLDIIEIHNSIIRISNALLDKEQADQPENKLTDKEVFIPLSTLKNYTLDLKDVLENYQVQSYTCENNSDFIPLKQKVFQKISISDSSLHGKVAYSIYPGFLQQDRILSAERVALYTNIQD